MLTREYTQLILVSILATVAFWGCARPGGIGTTRPGYGSARVTSGYPHRQIRTVAIPPFASRCSEGLHSARALAVALRGRYSTITPDSVDSLLFKKHRRSSRPLRRQSNFVELVCRETGADAVVLGEVLAAEHAAVVLGNKTGDHDEVEFRASCVDRAGTVIWQLAGRRAEMTTGQAPGYLESLWSKVMPPCTQDLFRKLPR